MAPSAPRSIFAPDESDPAPAIQLKKTSRWYGNVVAVNDISFEVGPGITGLLGPNGAGKTTILHMASGFLQPSSGTVEVFGKPAWRNPDMYRYVGLVPEREAAYPFLTGYEFVLLNARLHDLPDPEEAAARAIRAVDMEQAQHRPVGGYSKGMLQRVKFATALVHEPRVLLLDEPFSGTDPRQRLQMIDQLREMAAEGRTIVFSSHILEEVERLAENILVIVDGRLAASGDFHQIRRLMTDRPHTFTLRSSDNRRLAAALVADASVVGVELEDDRLSIHASDLAGFVSAAPRISQTNDITLFEVLPADESLESVFSYLVER
jgi:ABC-2 type transport system ATP-binding protein